MDVFHDVFPIFTVTGIDPHPLLTLPYRSLISTARSRGIVKKYQAASPVYSQTVDWKEWVIPYDAP